MSRVENVDLRVALQLFCFFEKLLWCCICVFRVDFEKYPGLIDVEYYNVTMQAGDCLFIPQRW